MPKLSINFNAFTTRLRYPLAMFLIVLPTALLGIIGSLGLSNLEQEPTRYFEDANLFASRLRTDINRQVTGRIPEAVPGVRVLSVLLRSIADENQLTGEYTVLTSELALKWQSAYFREGQVRRFANRALTFRGDELSSIIPFQEVSPQALSEVTRSQLMAARERNLLLGLPEGFVSFSTNSSTKTSGETLFNSATYYIQIPANADVNPGASWVAWELDTNALEREMLSLTKNIQSNFPLRYRIERSNAIPREEKQVSFILPIDPSLFPNWVLRATVDPSLMPINNETWRSNFYLALIIIVIPLLAGFLWFIEVGLRREIEDAKNKVDFVANISHELKTPLTSIRMFIEMLLLGRTRSEEETRESLTIILKESERLGRLIDRVLDFNKLERNKRVFERRPEDMARIVRDTVKLFRSDDRGSERQIKLAMQGGLPPVEIDRDSIREVILNLLSNACKYSDPDTPVSLRLHREGKLIHLDVVDQGRGIDAKDQARIFEKFYRVDDVLNRQVEGTGLGLSISLQIARAHKGDVTVVSVKDAGSTFTLTLPAMPEGTIPVAESQPSLPPVR